ncbi:MAG: stage 0 sporulation protein [Lachnospiraceae bacterium]|nr:stage 0 sporulation protein [Lachnospiraceae bacterium]
MPKMIGVRFKSVGRIYYFDPGQAELAIGDRVVVETSRGIELGSVVIAPRELPGEGAQALKAITRVATPADIATDEQNRQKEKDAFAICNEKIRKHGLEMKLVEVEYNFDRSKIMFYFSAEDRVDFRELVKDLASVFKTRIELRQIGVRDETKSLGGIGMCGRVLCCHGYLPDFVPVSIKMAKEQNLPLNPTKISGVCGRLMCCLKYEEETYEYLNSQMPSVGDYVETEDGYKGEIISANVLRQKVKVKIDVDSDDREVREYAACAVKVTERSRRAEPQLSKSEEAELARLESDDSDAQESTQDRKRGYVKPGPGRRPDAERFGDGRKNDRKQGGQGRPYNKGVRPDSRPADTRPKRDYGDRKRGNK